MTIWEFLKWVVAGSLGLFYSLLTLAFIFKVYRALTTPVDEIDLIDSINRKNEAESLIEWGEKDN